MSVESPHPDKPISFGYKAGWLAVRAESPDHIATFLPLKNPRPANWREGIEFAYKGQVFVTPQLGNWILAVSTSLPDSGDAHHPDTCTPWLLGLGRSFPEVQYFDTHRVIEYHAWARIVNGLVVRKYAYVGEQGLVMWNEGPLTEEEKALGLVFSDNIEAGDARFPSEDDVMRLAGAWSIDPTMLESQNFPPGVGLLGSLALQHAPQPVAGVS